MTNSLLKLVSGSTLDNKYRINDVIGNGAMGYIYKATNIVLKREVAIKTLQKPKVTLKDTGLRRFQQEAKIAASVNHDNVCEVIDFGVHQPANGEFDIFYLVMPLLKGQSLGQWFNSWVKPSPSVFIDIISQTLLGLQAAHDMNIVHRNLNPDNIFITNIGDRDNFVKVLDFGISKYLESETSPNLTQTGIAMGTPLYMAPEQAKGAKHINSTADLYSIGVVLYEGFVGQLPYQGESFNEVLLQITSRPFPAPREVNPHVPKSIEKVILRAMSRAPVDRFENAMTMRQALLEASSTADIKNRESFVYAVASASPLNSPIKETISNVEPAQNFTSNARVGGNKAIEAKLKAATVSTTKNERESNGSNRRTFRVLIGIIIVSLIIVVSGLTYIFGRQHAQTEESANVVPPVPTSQATAPTPPLSPIPTVETEEPTVRMPDSDQMLRVTHPQKKELSTTAKKTSKPAPKADPHVSKKTNERKIERDVESIFD